MVCVNTHQMQNMKCPSGRVVGEWGIQELVVDPSSSACQRKRQTGLWMAMQALRSRCDTRVDWHLPETLVARLLLKPLLQPLMVYSSW